MENYMYKICERLYTLVHIYEYDKRTKIYNQAGILPLISHYGILFA